MAITILHIDTSGQKAEAMIAVDGIAMHQQSSDVERDHAGRINMLVAEVLQEAGCELPSLDAIAVCNGPGSYTGLRIGLATAKGYCFAYGKPLILHNRLHLMQRELESQIHEQEVNKLAILPARAGEYYVAAAGEYNTTPRHITTAELLQNIANARKSFVVIGSPGTDLFTLDMKENLLHHSLDMSIWANVTFESFMQSEFADVAYAEPEYLKSAYITTSRTDR